ncbi:MAG TPA: aminoacyl-tRNA hydrolase [Synergistales bacterium]|nr:aminoacyl-tRNA hydrolase [Synergistales bacterium]
MRLIVGLGNPGPRYTFTRHNIGWLVIDHLTSVLTPVKKILRFESEVFGPVKSAGQTVLFLKPLTFMNLSGQAVRKAISFYGIALTDVLIIYDDVALPLGKLRLRSKGTAGGHNGMASVIRELGTLDIPRLRIGVGEHRGDIVEYVLSPFNAYESDALESILCDAAKAADMWLSNDIELAMNRINAKENNG